MIVSGIPVSLDGKIWKDNTRGETKNIHRDFIGFLCDAAKAPCRLNVYADATCSIVVELPEHDLYFTTSELSIAQIQLLTALWYMTQTRIRIHGAIFDRIKKEECLEWITKNDKTLRPLFSVG